MSATRQTYQIPAREVVPGILYVHADGSGTSMITDVERRDGGLIFWRQTQTGSWADMDGVVQVQIPGPSPRELACTCVAVEIAKARAEHREGRWMEAARKMSCMSPGEHDKDCPVSPVPDCHGGLRIWPAPWRGQAWGLDIGARAWTVGRKIGERHFFDRSDIEVAVRGWHEPGINDVVLQCFYLPPEPQPERREPTLWAPHAGYDDLAVRYG